MSDGDSDDDMPLPLVNKKIVEVAPVPAVNEAVATPAPAPAIAAVVEPAQPAAPAPAPAASAPKPKAWGQSNPIVRANSSNTHTPAVTPASTTSAPAQRQQQQQSQPKAAPTTAAATKKPAVHAASWGELTATLGGSKSAASAPAQNVPAPAGLVEDEDVVTSAPAVAAGVTFDPELDSSRDGLPLLFKSMNKSAGDATMSVIEEEECSKSRQGTKRKAEGQTVEEAAPAPTAAPADAPTAAQTQTQPAVDMTQLVATLKSAPAAAPAKVAWGGAGLKPATSAPIAAAPAASQPAAVPAVHAPLVKRQRRNNGAAAAPAPQLSRPSSLARPSSFLGAVTGVDTPVAAADSASPASAAAAPAASSSSAAPAAAAPSTPKKAHAPPTAAQRAMREKQIALGKRTVGYLNYIAQVPVAQRLPSHPRTPDAGKACSKRSMDGQLRQWRRLLHEWDPEVIEARKNGTYVEPTGSATDAAASGGLMEDAAVVEGAEGESDGELVDVEKSSAAASEDSYVVVQ